MSSAKRINFEEVIQQIKDEDFDFFFEGSDEDFGLNSSSDDDNEIRTHGLSDSKISNYSSLLLVTIKFLVQDAKPSDEEESNEQGSLSESCTQHSRRCASRERVVRGHISRQHGRGGRRQHRNGSSCDESRLWTSVPSEVQENPFTNNVRPTIPISDDDNPFLKFFPHELISHIVNETNNVC